MTNLNRRNFLKGSGAAAALTAFSPAVNAATIAGTKTERTLTASKYGVFYAEVVDGKFVDAIPFEKDPHPNHVIQALPDRVYAQTRVKYPYVRESFLKHGHKSDTSKRGKERFVRVSWEKAYELCANEMNRVQKDYGPDSVFGGCLGWQSVGAFHKHYNTTQRFFKLCGGFCNDKGSYSTGSIRVIMPHATGTIASIYTPSSWDITVRNVETLVIWGADPYITNRISGMVPSHLYYSYMEKLKQRKDVKIININPVYTETAQKLDAEQISIVPNTDVAMMIGIANYMYKNNLHDKKFLKRYTIGSEKFFDYITGKTDGVDKTPEWAEKITSVPAEKIKELAKLFTSTRTTLAAGWAMQRADHGEQPHWMVTTLAAMIGQIGLPGGGFNYGGQHTGLGEPSTDAPPLSGFPKKFSKDVQKKMPWVNRKNRYIPVASISRALQNPGQAFQYNGKNLTYPDIKMIWWAGGNPFHHHQDVADLAKAWQKPETVIVNEVYWTATARMADIILPVTTSLERNDLQYLGRASKQAIVAVKKVIEPVGESKSDFEIFSGILEKMNPAYKEAYTEGLDEMGWVKKLYNKALKEAKNKKVLMLEFDEFWKKGITEFEITQKGKDFVLFEKFRKNPRKNRLGTPSGKIEIFSETIDGFNYKECAGHPKWFEPAEYLGSKKAKKYPFHIVSPHPKNRLHSQMDNTWFRHVYEVQGREPILINEEDAKAKGIKDGDVVRVFNDRGEILAGAVVTNTIRKNVVQINEGAWYSPVDFKNGNLKCAHGHVNTLTLDKPTSNLAFATSANTCLVDFEKYEGVLPPVTVFTPPELV